MHIIIPTTLKNSQSLNLVSLSAALFALFANYVLLRHVLEHYVMPLMNVLHNSISRSCSSKRWLTLFTRRNQDFSPTPAPLGYFPAYKDHSHSFLPWFLLQYQGLSVAARRFLNIIDKHQEVKRYKASLFKSTSRVTSMTESSFLRSNAALSL